MRSRRGAVQLGGAFVADLPPVRQLLRVGAGCLAQCGCGRVPRIGWVAGGLGLALAEAGQQAGDCGEQIGAASASARSSATATSYGVPAVAWRIAASSSRATTS